MMVACSNNVQLLKIQTIMQWSFLPILLVLLMLLLFPSTSFRCSTWLTKPHAQVRSLQTIIDLKYKKCLQLGLLKEEAVLSEVEKPEVKIREIDMPKMSELPLRTSSKRFSYGLLQYVLTWFTQFVHHLWLSFIDFLIKELKITKHNPIHHSNMTIIDMFHYWKDTKALNTSTLTAIVSLQPFQTHLVGDAIIRRSPSRTRKPLVSNLEGINDMVEQEHISNDKNNTIVETPMKTTKSFNIEEGKLYAALKLQELDSLLQLQQQSSGNSSDIYQRRYTLTEEDADDDSNSDSDGEVEAQAKESEVINQSEYRTNNWMNTEFWSISSTTNYENESVLLSSSPTTTVGFNSNQYKASTIPLFNSSSLDIPSLNNTSVIMQTTANEDNNANEEDNADEEVEEKRESILLSSDWMVGSWQLIEYRNNISQPLLDTLRIPSPSHTPYTPNIIISQLNGSLGHHWHVHNQSLFECTILRGVSQTKWLRNPSFAYSSTMDIRNAHNQSNNIDNASSVKPLIVSVIRPPKPPYDQLPTKCVYRGQVKQQQEQEEEGGMMIEGKVFRLQSASATAEEEGRQEGECIGRFEMRKITTK